MSADVLSFPERRKPGRKRRAASMDAAGVLSLRALARVGEPVPANVVRFDQPKGPDPTTPARSSELLLALAIFSTLTGEQKRAAREMIANFAGDGERAAIRLQNLFGLYDAVAKTGADPA